MTTDTSRYYAWQAFRAMSRLASSREQLGASDATETHAAASRIAESVLADGGFDVSHTAYLQQSAVDHALRAGDVARWRELARRYHVAMQFSTSTANPALDASAKTMLEIIVTKLILESERKEGDDPARAASLYRDLSRYEELLADVCDAEPDLTIAREGAVRAARNAGAFAREHALALRYAPLIPTASTVVVAPEASPAEQRRLRWALLVLLATMAAWPSVASLLDPSLSDVMAGMVCTVPAVAFLFALALLGRKS